LKYVTFSNDFQNTTEGCLRVINFIFSFHLIPFI